MFELPDLPYPYEALEPYIDEKTMRIHHGKHHAGYVKKLNAAMEGRKVSSEKIGDILANLDNLPKEIRKTVRNNGGGHANHSLFWKVMSQNAEESLESELSESVDSAFGSLENLKAGFSDAASGVFGSGWAWLVVSGGKLKITNTPNQDSPYLEGETPILGLDVWEHAYYLKYQNKRGDYIKAWWNLVDWRKVSDNFARAN